ncbi:hypothetical protein CORC01_01931 [Colletotrichum orchidophilum]|uniref:Uncharacterized protein n=1 Tax=Colletotrichum orchidophilum TaxID=1209926 RepID=A0A1G4BMY7_9PEZI|nr:uncharacterized protein CORC01_01931 [Colletotrichum orchidophilum]OHF02830.1 hypothetical protein CORC01_01931 [Colletotrichum orchidophilum]
MTSNPANEGHVPGPAASSSGSHSHSRAEDWIPSFHDGELTGEDEDACSQILTLITGGHTTTLHKCGIIEAWKGVTRQLYPYFQKEDWAWVSTTVLKYATMQEFYKMTAHHKKKPFATLGFTVPANLIEDLDEGYAEYLEANHSEYFEANKHRIPKKHVPVASPSIEAGESSKRKQPEPEQPKDVESRKKLKNEITKSRETDPKKPEAPETSALKEITMSLQPESIWPGPSTPSAPVATRQPSKIESMILAGRKDLKEFFQICKYDNIALEKGGFPFEVRVPDGLSPAMAERVYRHKDQVTKISKMLDPRLRLLWIDHDKSTFLVLMKSDPKVNYCDIGSYPASWWALKAWSGSAVNGQVATLSDFIRNHEEKVRCESVETQNKVLKDLAQKSQDQAKGNEDEMLASIRRGSDEAQLGALRARVSQDLFNSKFKRTARWNRMVNLYLNGEQMTRPPGQLAPSLSLNDVRMAIQDTWSVYKGDDQMEENALEATDWAWKMKKEFEEDEIFSMSTFQIMERLGLAE